MSKLIVLKLPWLLLGLAAAVLLLALVKLVVSLGTERHPAEHDVHTTRSTGGPRLPTRPQEPTTSPDSGAPSRSSHAGPPV